MSVALDQGPSIQVVGTPDDFLAAFRERFGPIAFDLAATAENAVTGDTSYFGPWSPLAEDALTQDWAKIRGNLWLNPEFADIEPWARKSAQEGQRGALVNLLVPLSSSNWARDWCWSQAIVYPLNPRLVFKGHSASFPKDLMLVRYGVERQPRAELWKWR